jgi:hypothetical protein
MVTERDDLTAEGLRCAGCSMRSEIEGHERNVAEERKQRSLNWRVSWIAWAHFVLWVVAAWVFSVANGGVHHDWLLPLEAVAIGGRIVLHFRERWALYVALGLDGVMIVGPFVAALFAATADAFVAAAIVGVCPLIFGLLLYSLRHAYDPASKVSPVPEEKPKQKWSAPGRQF